MTDTILDTSHTCQTYPCDDRTHQMAILTDELRGVTQALHYLAATLQQSHSMTTGPDTLELTASLACRISYAISRANGEDVD